MILLIWKIIENFKNINQRSLIFIQDYDTLKFKQSEMEISKIYLVGIISILLISLAIGENLLNYRYKRLVPSGPDPIESPPSPNKPLTQNFKVSYDIKRLVPSGPDPIESPPSPIKSQTQNSEFNYEIKRLVPSGPDPIESPPSPNIPST